MRSTLKATFGAMFDSLGFPTVTTQRATATQRAAATEPAQYIAGLFAAMKIDLVIDHGADSGQFGDFLRRQVGYAGPIASFEAIGVAFEALKARAAADDRWETEQASFGARGGELPLNVIDLKNFRATGGAADGSRPATLCGAARIRRDLVPVLTVDDVLPPLLARTGARRVFFRLGGLGDARDVLKGAERMLCQIAAIQTELSTSRKVAGMPHYLAMLSYFEAKHFTPNGFFAAHGPPPDEASFACCLVNTVHGKCGRQ